MMTTTAPTRTPGAGRPAPVPGRPGRRRGRLVLALALVLVVVAGALGTAGLLADQAVQARYGANVDRFPDPSQVLGDESRPAPVSSESGVARNYLLLGSDSRVSAGDPSQWQVGAQRTDAIMIAHVAADGSGVSVLSIPRDTWVEVPGHGEAKVNAAFSYGGPTLLVQTVEQLTGARIDHVAVVDFEGFVDVTDALGGVRITVPQTTSDKRGTFEAGTTTMDGEEALRYVRQRYGLDGGDFDRVKRHQNWLRAMASEALSRNTLTSPSTLDAFLVAATSSVAVDDGFDAAEVRDLALRLRAVRTDDIRFFTVPTTGTGRSTDGQSIVLLDEPAAAELWAALREDDVQAWLDTSRADVLGDVVE